MHEKLKVQANQTDEDHRVDSLRIQRGDVITQDDLDAQKKERAYKMRWTLRWHRLLAFLKLRKEF